MKLRSTASAVYQNKEHLDQLRHQLGIKHVEVILNDLLIQLEQIKAELKWDGAIAKESKVIAQDTLHELFAKIKDIRCNKKAHFPNKTDLDFWSSDCYEVLATLETIFENFDMYEYFDQVQRRHLPNLEPGFRFNKEPESQVPTAPNPNSSRKETFSPSQPKSGNRSSHEQTESQRSPSIIIAPQVEEESKALEYEVIRQQRTMKSIERPDSAQPLGWSHTEAANLLYDADDDETIGDTLENVKSQIANTAE